MKVGLAERTSLKELDVAMRAKYIQLQDFEGQREVLLFVDMLQTFACRSIDELAETTEELQEFVGILKKVWRVQRVILAMTDIAEKDRNDYPAIAGLNWKFIKSAPSK